MALQPCISESQFKKRKHFLNLESVIPFRRTYPNTYQYTEIYMLTRDHHLTHTKIYLITGINPLVRALKFVCQRVRNVSFSENFAYSSNGVYPWGKQSKAKQTEKREI